jgi:translation initiation factor IF-2
MRRPPPSPAAAPEALASPALRPAAAFPAPRATRPPLADGAEPDLAGAAPPLRPDLGSGARAGQLPPRPAPSPASAPQAQPVPAGGEDLGRPRDRVAQLTSPRRAAINAAAASAAAALQSGRGAVSGAVNGGARSNSRAAAAAGDAGEGRAVAGDGNPAGRAGGDRRGRGPAGRRAEASGNQRDGEGGGRRPREARADPARSAAASRGA